MIGLVPRYNLRWMNRVFQSELKRSYRLFPLARCISQTLRFLSSNAKLSYIKSLYSDSPSPTAIQTLAASKFFASHVPEKSWTATEWRQQPHSESTFLAPEIVFLGRSNSGKSSLLNALLNDSELCRVGPKPGKTVVMHAWALSPIPPKTIGTKKRFQGTLEPKLTVLDMPGYGHGSHSEWGKHIVKYLTRRRQLRRAFVLVNPVHGLKESDLQTLALLRENGIAHQLIACKCDAAKPSELPRQLADIGKSVDEHFRQRQERIALITINDILAVGNLGDGKSNSRVRKATMAGIEDVRWAIIRAAGLEEYAMALVGGMHELKPRVELLPKLEETSVEPPKLDNAVTVTQSVTKIEHINDNREYVGTRPGPIGQREVSTSVQDQANPVGIGMDDFISMLNPEAKSRSSAAMPRRTGFSQSQASSRIPSRREQLRSRRLAKTV